MAFSKFLPFYETTVFDRYFWKNDNLHLKEMTGTFQTVGKVKCLTMLTCYHFMLDEEMGWCKNLSMRRSRTGTIAQISHIKILIWWLDFVLSVCLKNSAVTTANGSFRPCESRGES